MSYSIKRHFCHYDLIILNFFHKVQYENDVRLNIIIFFAKN